MNMNPIGVIRRVDDLGRVVIPRELRKRQGIVEGTPMEISMREDGTIILKRQAYAESLLPLCLAMQTQLAESYMEVVDELGEDQVKKLQAQLKSIYTLLKKENR